MYHQTVVGGEMDVKFDGVRTKLPGAFERRHRVFGGVGAGATMRHDGYAPGHAAEHFHEFRPAYPGRDWMRSASGLEERQLRQLRESE
jgi:hypothetical protein